MRQLGYIQQPAGLYCAEPSSSIAIAVAGGDVDIFGQVLGAMSGVRCEDVMRLGSDWVCGDGEEVV